jgi:SMI1 / KNR4 family (SUKH-1)
MTALDRIEANLAALRVWAEEGKPLPFIDEGHDFVIGEPMREVELLAIERQFQVTLPTEYRAFLGRFGDTTVGPGNRFRRIREGLTAGSKESFPLAKPFLGTCSPSHQMLSNEREWDAFQDLLEQWGRIPKDNGVLCISDYGCAMYGVLVLNGPNCGQVWFLAGDAAYYGPFGGFEALHDESAAADCKPSETPREYSFFEWYESWLDVRLKMAGHLA